MTTEERQARRDAVVEEMVKAVEAVEDAHDWIDSSAAAAIYGELLRRIEVMRDAAETAHEWA